MIFVYAEARKDAGLVALSMYNNEHTSMYSFTTMEMAVDFINSGGHVSGFTVDGYNEYEGKVKYRIFEGEEHKVFMKEVPTIQTVQVPGVKHIFTINEEITNVE